MIWRRRRGKTVARPDAPIAPQGDPSLTIDCRHLPEGVEALVRDWFAGSIRDFELSGARSVLIPFENNGCTHIKIKGAGFNGGGVQFGRLRQSGPDAPLFDYDGRRMVDVALGHDGAYFGGASMQQAVTEWRVSRFVDDLGMPVVPCVGYGSLFNGTHRSWFSVYQWKSDWIDVHASPTSTVDDYKDLGFNSGMAALDLALNHNLVGFLSALRDPGGTYVLKDLHPFRRIDPFNYSQLSWVMQVYHGLHVIAINTHMLVSNRFGEDAAVDAGVSPIWSFLPDATRADWDRLRFSLVAGYMNKDPVEFSTIALLRLLEENPISAKLLEICPPEFARVREAVR